MKKMTTPFAVAMGAALSLGASYTNAESNLFGATELSSGYMQLAASEMACGAGMKMDMPKTAEGACAGKKTASSTEPTKATEGKCGDMMDGDKMKKGMESACGAMMKGKEGACGAMQGAMKEGACGAMMNKAPEGSCGAQCADNMKNCAAAKTQDGACGANMKGCGELMQGCTEMNKAKDGSCGAAKSEASPSSNYKIHPYKP